MNMVMIHQKLDLKKAINNLFISILCYKIVFNLKEFIMYDIYMLNNTSKTIKDMFIIGVNKNNTKYEHTILTKLDNIIGYKFIMRNSIWIFNSNPKPYKNTMSFSAICQKNNFTMNPMKVLNDLL